MNRKIIFKARIGSHLHGTNTPTSDEDFLGVFLPSTNDLVGMQNRPTEWTENQKISTTARNTKGDVDCKYLALYEFFRQAAQGQSQALELFFVPNNHVIISTPEWELIKEHKDLFISQKGILPIVGFALAQAYKSKIKGENLNKINNLIERLDVEIKNGNRTKSIKECLDYDHSIGAAWLFGVDVIHYTNSHGYELMSIANRDYDVGTSIKRLRESLEILEAKYGSRSRMAASSTYDFKSATHAFRLIGEAEEFIQTGNITFPRPDAEFLLKVKNKEYYGDLETDIQSRLDTLKQVLVPKSPLKAEPNHSKINSLCKRMLLEHIDGALDE